MVRKPVFVIVMSIVLYFLISVGLTDYEKTEREDSVKLPKKLLKIMFPFSKTEKMPLICIVSTIYVWLSNACIYITYFIYDVIWHKQWNWKVVNTSWVTALFGTLYLVLIVTLGMCLIKSKDNLFIKIATLLVEILLIFLMFYYGRYIPNIIRNWKMS